MAPKLVSIAICTHQRAEVLRGTLHSLVDLRVPAGWKMEVVVVDNACTDGTPAVIQEAEAFLPVVPVYCGELGISNARNAAVQGARGDVIVWLDDDVRPEADLIEVYARSLDARPDVAIFGGQVTPHFEGTPPRWLLARRPELDPVFSLRFVDSSDAPFGPGQFPVGANFMARAEVHHSVSFNGRLGRRGQTGPLGEDTAFFLEAHRLGFRGTWVPEARVAHLIPRARQSARYVAEWYAAYAEQRESLEFEESKGGRRPGFPRWAVRVWLESTLSYGALRLLRKPEGWLAAVCRMGTAVGVLRYYWTLARRANSGSGSR